MASAAVRIFLFVAIALGGAFTSPAAAGTLDTVPTLTSDLSSTTSQSLDVTDVTGTLDDAVSGVTDTVNDATGSLTDTVSGATGEGSSGVDSVTGSVTSVLSGSSESGASATSSPSGGSGGSSSTSDGGTSSSKSRSVSNRGSPDTKFDRLPRRYETLLERIESGIQVRASIRQLRALLATASPALRVQILRLIRQEIRSLERVGLTRRERGAVRRLRSLLAALDASRPSSSQVSVRPVGASALPVSTSGGRVEVLRASARSTLAGEAPDDARETPSGIFRPPFLLPSPTNPAYWLLFLLAGIAGGLWLITRAPARVLPASVRGMVEARGAEMSALAITFGLIVGLGAAMLLL